MPDATPAAEPLVRLHRAFVVALGGYAVELAGGVLVTHERVPVGPFNFVDEVRVAPARQTAFFERALDHYFQRALRPTFRVDPPVPPHVDATLRRFGFRPTLEPRIILAARRGHTTDAHTAGVEVLEAGPDEVAKVAAFWTHEKERDEFLRSLEVAVSHPNPGERLVPLLGLRGDVPVAAALVFSRDGLSEIHAVSTRPDARGHGIATAVVAYAAASSATEGTDTVTIASATPRLSHRLEPIGFREVARTVEYELPLDTRLEMPDPGPPTPPRWRPPRGGAPPSRATGAPGRA